MSSPSFDDAMAAFAPELPLLVAFSGGADSTALLLACARRWPGRVAAVHVHHGLQAAADAFAASCAALCASIDVPLVVRRVDARAAAGDSPEAVARAARYRALDAVARGADGAIVHPSVAIAQHADDQAETLLLALSRGAGLPGLAAMPARQQRLGVVYHRPLLAVHAAEIRAWLRQQGVAHVEDPSNADQGLTRNRIRARLLPALDAGFAQFRETFARSARHAAQAQLLLEELAREDMAGLASASCLSIEGLRAMSPARQANLLRHWLRTAHGVVASEAQLRELLRQLAACATRGHQIRIRIANGFARRSGAVLAWYNSEPDPTPPD